MGFGNSIRKSKKQVPAADCSIKRRPESLNSRTPLTASGQTLAKASGRSEVGMLRDFCHSCL
jgi:hypothetical protein